MLSFLYTTHSILLRYSILLLRYRIHHNYLAIAIYSRYFLAFIVFGSCLLGFSFELLFVLNFVVCFWLLFGAFFLSSSYSILLFFSYILPEFLCCCLGMIFNFLFNTNHIFIGVVYIVIGLIGGSLGFGLSIIIRLELGLPGFNNVSSLNYNSVITFHGLFMIFFMIMPILIGGFGNLLCPILLSCNDMIFPRLNLLSLWLSMFSLILIMLSFVIDSGVNAG